MPPQPMSNRLGAVSGHIPTLPGTMEVWGLLKTIEALGF